MENITEQLGSMGVEEVAVPEEMAILEIPTSSIPTSSVFNLGSGPAEPEEELPYYRASRPVSRPASRPASKLQVRRSRTAPPLRAEPAQPGPTAPGPSLPAFPLPPGSLGDSPPEERTKHKRAKENNVQEVSNTSLEVRDRWVLPLGQNINVEKFESLLSAKATPWQPTIPLPPAQSPQPASEEVPRLHQALSPQPSPEEVERLYRALKGHRREAQRSTSNSSVASGCYPPPPL